MAASAVFVLTRDGAEIIVGRLQCERADLVLIDALARLHLAAKGLGCRLSLRDASDDLASLIWLAGLDSLLGESRGQAEGSEQIRIEEVVDLDDPVA